MFAFIPLASAIAASDTPGCRQAAKTCALNSEPCRRRVLLGAAFTTWVSMCPQKIRGHFPPIRRLARRGGWTHTPNAHSVDQKCDLKYELWGPAIYCISRRRRFHGDWGASPIRALATTISWVRWLKDSYLRSHGSILVALSAARDEIQFPANCFENANLTTSYVHSVLQACDRKYELWGQPIYCTSRRRRFLGG